MFGLQWIPEFRPADVLTVIGFLATGFALWFTWREFRRNGRVQRAQFLLDITNRYFSDAEIKNLYYQIEWEKFKFNYETLGHGGKEEQALDNLLYTFDIIGHLVKIGTLNKEDVNIIAYQAARVLNNAEVQKYLVWLDGWYKKVGRLHPAHADARYLVQHLLK